MAHGTEDTNITVSLLFGAIYAVHQALIVDAMPESKLMANFVTHDSTGAHQEIFLSIWITYAIPCRIKATEREATNTLRETCPAEAKGPIRTWVKILHRNAETGVRIRWAVVG